MAAIAQGREASNAQVDPHVSSAARDGRLDCPFGLDAGVPPAAGLAQGDVLRHAQHRPAVAVSKPAELRQEEPVVDRVDLELLRIGVAKALAPSLALEAREVRTARKEVLVRTLQIFQRLLQGVGGRVRQPGRLSAVPPLREQPAQPRVAEFLLPPFVALLLQGQCLVENEAARPRKAAHAPLLLAVRQDLVLVGLQPLHGAYYIFAHTPQQQRYWTIYATLSSARARTSLVTSPSAVATVHRAAGDRLTCRTDRLGSPRFPSPP